MADLASEATDLADEMTASQGGAAPGNDDLLGELARAMHAAATSQYERMNAELERRRSEQVDAIAAHTAADTEHLKTSTEQDIAAIDAWAKTETEKIKQERLRRIDARREQLASQLERQDTIRQREIFAIEAAIDAHRGEIDQFFGRMERETDPTAIARVASSLPPFPSLAEIAEQARRIATAEFNGLERDVALAPAPATSPVETAPAPEAPSNAASSNAMPDGTVSASRLMAVMDPDATRGESASEPSPWEAAHAVGVAAGSNDADAEAASSAEGHGRMGSTLLRTVRAIRPMAAEKDDPSR